MCTPLLHLIPFHYSCCTSELFSTEIIDFTTFTDHHHCHTKIHCGIDSIYHMPCVFLREGCSQSGHSWGCVLILANTTWGSSRVCSVTSQCLRNVTTPVIEMNKYEERIKCPPTLIWNGTRDALDKLGVFSVIRTLNTKPLLCVLMPSDSPSLVPFFNPMK